MTDKELQQLALDLFSNKIFTDRQIRKEDFTNLFPLIFMPVALGAWNKLERKNVGLVYEYLDKALPRSVNGYPCFTSMHILSRSEAKKLANYYAKLKSAAENAFKN